MSATSALPTDQKYRVFLVDSSGEIIGDPVTPPLHFSSALAFCRGMVSRMDSFEVAREPFPVPMLVESFLPSCPKEMGQLGQADQQELNQDYFTRVERGDSMASSPSQQIVDALAKVNGELQEEAVEQEINQGEDEPESCASLAPSLAD